MAMAVRTLNLTKTTVKGKGGVDVLRYTFQRVVKGRRKRISTGVDVGGEKEYRIASAKKVEIEARLDREEKGAATVTPLRVDEYWETKFRPTHSHPGDDHRMARFLFRFGRFMMAKVDTTGVAQFLLDAANGKIDPKQWGPLEPGSINRHRGLLQGFFNRALNDGQVLSNPFIQKDGKPIPDEAPTAVGDRVITPDEQAKALTVMSPKFQRWFIFMLGTALRIDEACDVVLPMRRVCTGRVGRKLKNICTNTLQINLNAGVDQQGRVFGMLHVRGRDEHLLPGKNYGRNVAKFGKCRDIRLSPKVVEAILAQQADGVVPLPGPSRTRERQCVQSLWNATPSAYRDLCARTALDANIPHFSPHALRRTYATRFAKAGGALIAVSKFLGHSSVKVTEDYINLSSDEIAEMGDHIDVGL